MRKVRLCAVEMDKQMFKTILNSGPVLFALKLKWMCCVFFLFLSLKHKLSAGSTNQHAAPDNNRVWLSQFVGLPKGLFCFPGWWVGLGFLLLLNSMIFLKLLGH